MDRGALPSAIDDARYARIHRALLAGLLSHVRKGLQRRRATLPVCACLSSSCIRIGIARKASNGFWRRNSPDHPPCTRVARTKIEPDLMSVAGDLVARRTSTRAGGGRHSARGRLSSAPSAYRWYVLTLVARRRISYMGVPRRSGDCAAVSCLKSGAGRSCQQGAVLAHTAGWSPRWPNRAQGASGRTCWSTTTRWSRTTRNAYRARIPPRASSAGARKPSTSRRAVAAALARR